ncbi:hypothetical protein CCAL12920_00695 [Campylobacter sp. RM12920]|uniref:Uncharacterized protein n=1 Tax=Campylobacter californiensis TaxID=1032243 RepID=A0ABD4JH05_9BACT|nr:hypothetical protein [Campylobacter sp. RM9328]MBE2985553.1 hypothetical protein [Campylobacter sp. RM12919]MBE2987418.1 hypothetical protein [Campylobacter sp. RM12920]
MKLRDLIGVSFNELDCFALVRKAYEIERGVIIPPAKSKAERSGMVFNEFLKEISSNWRRVEKQKGVCVAIRYDINHPKIVTHFGYMVDENHILHTTKDTGAVIERFKNLEKLVEGFYEYVS